MEYERVELVQPNFGGVNAYRVGDTLVDTGHVCPESRDLLQEALVGSLSGVARVVLTHPHIDHAGGSLTVDPVSDLPHIVYEGADAMLRGYTDYLREAREEMASLAAPPGEHPAPDDVYFPVDRDYATDLAFEQVVGDGDTVAVGPDDCTVVHTPGHSQQHMALFHEPSGVMVSGDIVSRNGHFMYGPVHWDIGAYKTSLRRVRDLEPTVLLPGHGDPMDDPVERATDALEKAEAAEQAVLDAVGAQGPMRARDLARAAFGASDEAVDFLGSVAAVYALHLADRGLLGIERQPSVVAHPVYS